jgi:hypothetical protein
MLGLLVSVCLSGRFISEKRDHSTPWTRDWVRHIFALCREEKNHCPCWDSTAGTQSIATHQAISADSPKLKRTLCTSFFCYISKILRNRERVSVCIFICG